MALDGKVSGPYAIKNFCVWLDQLGHEVVRLKGDQEATLQAFIDKICKTRPHRTVPMGSARYSSQSHGNVENMIKQIQGNVRTMKSWIELSMSHLLLQCGRG